MENFFVFHKYQLCYSSIVYTFFMIILSALAFILLLSVLIMIHEWGHYYAAKISGVVVEEFGFGLPPKAKTLFKRKGTEFTLNWVPFGGFVRLKGENAVTKQAHTAPGSFGAASIPARVLILCAGVLMNFILAIVILTFGFSVGRWVPTFIDLESMQKAVAEGSLQATLGVQIHGLTDSSTITDEALVSQTIISAIDGTPISSVAELQDLQTGKSTVEYTLLTPPEYVDTTTIMVPLIEGKAGIQVSETVYNIQVPLRNPVSALLLALRESYIMMVQTVKGIGQLFVSLASQGTVPDQISGIVGIAQLTHASVQAGIMTYLKLVALLSLSLAALNILPFPALDGGRLVFVLAEAISRRKVNRQFELIINTIGFVILLLLIVLITYHDIARLF